MPSNEIVINGNIKHEVPDSFMPPLLAYLDMVKEKCTPRDNCGFTRGELQSIRSRAFSLVEELPKTIPENDNWTRLLVALGDVTDIMDAIKAREDDETATENGTGWATDQ